MLYGSYLKFHLTMAGPPISVTVKVYKIKEENTVIY